MFTSYLLQNNWINARARKNKNIRALDDDSKGAAAQKFLEAGSFDGRLVIAMPVKLPEFFQFHLLNVAVRKIHVDRARKSLVRRKTGRDGAWAGAVSRNAKSAHAGAVPAELEIDRRQIGCERAEPGVDSLGEHPTPRAVLGHDGVPEDRSVGGLLNSVI